VGPTGYFIIPSIIGLRISLQAYTEPVPLKYGKLVTKYSRIYTNIFTVCTLSAVDAASVKFMFHILYIDRCKFGQN